ncbi:MAG: SprT family zinc-dependent metalloprotease [Chlorobiaceae bacterium]
MGAIQCDKQSFVYGSTVIDYSLLYCERKSMEIAVHPDCTVVVKAPEGAGSSMIEAKIGKRARWILRQLNYFRQFTPKTPGRFYVTGETHLYLGKQYRLKIAQGHENSVKLSRGFFHVTLLNEPMPETAKRLLSKWYGEKASQQFSNSLDRCWPKFTDSGFPKPAISVRLMQKRWGSLSGKGTVTLNTNLVKAPKECIDYVVIHELCHLNYHDHSAEFYKLLNTVMPGWEKVKQKLELGMV